MMDIHQIETEILQLLALIIGSLIVFALQRVASWLNIHISADRQAALESAVDKMMTLGVTEAGAVIRDKGWDHIDSKNTVINLALPALQARFETTLKNAGIDLGNDNDRNRLMMMMERMWPDVATRLSVSPATPPAPATAAVVAPVVIAGAPAA